MKKFLLPLAIFILVVMAVGVTFWWNNNLKSVSSNNEAVRFVIPKGYSASQTANKLYEQKLIRSPLAFRIYVQMKGVAGKIQAGEYDLTQSASLSKQVATLLKGPSSIWVTIPEGLRREEIVERFADGLSKEGDDRQVFIKEFLESSEGKEGFLFPDTYLFPKEMTAVKVVNNLLTTFDKRTADLGKDIDQSSLNLNEIITLASLIEREAKGVEERPVIAGILLNRINADWPLQVDAAVQYAVANLRLTSPTSKLESYWVPLTKDDLEINSPYNTYKYPGLPPSPIASPGLTSIKAAINPQDSQYWFYLHDREGNIHYAATIEEHNENIRLYLGKSVKE
jgi:UPF0755 protein